MFRLPTESAVTGNAARRRAFEIRMASTWSAKSDSEPLIEGQVVASATRDDVEKGSYFGQCFVQFGRPAGFVCCGRAEINPEISSDPEMPPMQVFHDDH